MRVVFMGTPDFAVPSLRALAREHEVVAVYTRPDAVSGRGRAAHPPAVKTAAASLGLPISQPASLRGPEAVADLAALAPDIVVVAAYGLILPPEVLAVPVHGCVNVHASLLPRWRGAAPIQRAILAGDEQTGVSIMRMEEGLDTGPYCVVRTTELDDKSATELTAELAELGAEAIVEAVRLIDSGACAWIEQDDALATYADKIAKADVALTPELGVTQALRRVRASTPQAPARLCVGDRCASVTAAGRAPDTLAPAAVACTKQALVLGLADGAILVERIRPDGRGEMPGCDWARGTRFDAATTWGPTS